LTKKCNEFQAYKIRASLPPHLCRCRHHRSHIFGYFFRAVNTSWCGVVERVEATFIRCGCERRYSSVSSR